MVAKKGFRLRPESKYYSKMTYNCSAVGTMALKGLVCQCSEKSGSGEDDNFILEQFSRFQKLLLSFLENGIVSANLFPLKSGVC